MPPVARALADPGGGLPTGTPAPTAALASVRGFIEEMTDHLVRSAQWPGGILPHPADLPRPQARGAAEDRWLEALGAPDPGISATKGKAADLAERLDEWRRPLARVQSASHRLCFRLEEPRSEDGDEDVPVVAGAAWRLRYLLQSVADPSLVVPLDRVWRPDAVEARAFAGAGLHPREFLLQALGQAARLSGAVRASLDDPEPSGADLDSSEAHGFLSEEAPLLREAGFVVLLPSWWTRDRVALGPSLRAHVRTPAMSARAGLGLEAIVSVRWDVALGGVVLSPDELRALAAFKAPLVRLRGQWVEVDARQIARALETLDRADETTLTAADAMRIALGAETGPGGFQVSEITADGWIAGLFDGLREDAEFELVPPPDGLAAALRPYQERGYSWLTFLARWGLGACLADDMGLGKTIQTLAWVQRDREQSAHAGSEPRAVLVVCPTSVATNWVREAARFAPGLRAFVHHGPDRAGGEDLAAAAREHDLVVTTYGLLHRDAAELAAVAWRGLVLDEAQNIKNPDSLRARAARALRADFRVALTGTPVENHVGDLWSVMEVLNPGLLGSRAAFKKTFFVPIQTFRDPGATRRLRRLTGPFLLRRLKTDPAVIDDLPDKVETKDFCTLTREQASLYQAVVQELEEALAGGAEEGIRRKGLILATLTRLKQVCNHPAHFLGDGSRIPGRSGKMDRLVEMLDELLDAGDRALVFTQFTAMGEILQRHLQATFGLELPFLHGGVSRARRETMVDAFQGGRGPGLFLISLKAGGTGLNLTAASHVFLFDRWWNPAVEAQAADRAYRIGQRRNVHVHRFVCAGTVEERIDEIVEGKREIARQVVGAGEGWLTELTNRELRDLLALGPDAASSSENGNAHASSQATAASER
jgi:SNF2 family DNA or RNA helicase